jgi:transposase
MITAAKTLHRHLPNLLTYIRYGITNATSEGINSKIQTLKQMACGYRNREHYKTAILFQCGGLDVDPRPAAA